MIIDARGSNSIIDKNGEMSFVEIGRLLEITSQRAEEIYTVAIRKVRARMGSELFTDLPEAHRGGQLSGGEARYGL